MWIDLGVEIALSMGDSVFIEIVGVRGSGEDVCSGGVIDSLIVGDGRLYRFCNVVVLELASCDKLFSLFDAEAFR